MCPDDAFSDKLDLETSPDDEQAISREERMELSERDMDALLAGLADPPAPNEAMLRSAQRWREHGAPH